jgi:hypothetical protein
LSFLPSFLSSFSHILLCALASSKEALTELCDNGGLEALSLVAGEGELSAIAALLEVRLRKYPGHDYMPTIKCIL